MTERRPSKAQLERRLKRLRRDYQAAKARLSEIGFICEGSLTELYTSCGNPNCRCADPEHRHGPYWQLTWKEHGKTVTRRLPAEDAAIYQQRIANRRQLEAALEQMRDLSRQAGEQILASPAVPTTAPSAPATRAAQPARKPSNPGTPRYPRVLRTSTHPSAQQKLRITRHFPLVLK